ncbi:MAG: hypothetical protein OIF56_12405, partial [Cohaesibacter sp.]|nr:hypothetical protein [Cohaesibacter sp.]
WMETIEYLYPKEEWYELGCSFGDFMEDVIKNEPDPLRLPENDRVIKRHFSFILEEYKAEDAARAASPKPDDQPPKPKLYGYDNLLYAIERFRAKELLFEEYMTNMTCLYNDVGYRLDYQGNWYADMVMWFEMIDYCYPREERHQLGCLVGDFIEHAIWHAPRPLSLPKDNPVIRDYFDQSSPAETTKTG